MTVTAKPQKPIAIVGVGALFPGSVDETGFWRDILAGADLIQDIPEEGPLRSQISRSISIKTILTQFNRL